MSIPAILPRRSDARLNRELIIAAAARVLQVDGDAGMDAIAAEAGLSRRALYGHFPTRDSLVEQVFAAGAIRIASILLPLDDADPRLAIATIGARLWREVAHIRFTAQLAVRGPYRAHIGEVLRPLRALVEHTVQTGIASGAFRQDVAAPLLARLVEAGALAVLDEATARNLSVDEGTRLVIVATLSCVGLDWVESGAIADRLMAGGLAAVDA